MSPLETFLPPEMTYRCGVCDELIPPGGVGGVRQMLYSKLGGVSGVVVFMTCTDKHSDQEIRNAYFEAKT
jgi:hypothetical protein